VQLYKVYLDKYLITCHVTLTSCNVGLCHCGNCFSFFCYNICAIAAFLQVANGRFSVNLESDGAYHVFVNKQQWLTNGPTFFRINGMSHSTSNGSLKQIGEPVAISGKDTLGQWNGQTLLYAADEAKVSVSIRTYDTGRGELAVFTQVLSQRLHIPGVTVVLKFLKFQKQNCPEIVLKLQIVLKL